MTSIHHFASDSGKMQRRIEVQSESLEETFVTLSLLMDIYAIETLYANSSFVNVNLTL